MRIDYVRWFVVALLVIGATPMTWAFREGTNSSLPNFDKRQERLRAAGKAQRDRQPALTKLRERLPTANVDWDEVIGAPRSISCPRGVLCGPDGQGGAVSPESARSIAADDPHRPSKAFVREHRELFGFGPETLDRARILRDSVTPHNGLQSVVWEQRVDGIAVFGGLFVSHTTRRGELVSISSHFVAEPEQAAERGKAKAAARRHEPILGARKAVALSARNLGETLEEESIQPVNEARAESETERRQKFNAASLHGDTSARLVWLPTDAATLRLCWEVVLTSRSRGEMFRLLVDAETGELQVRQCLTEYLGDATYRVFTSDSPSPFSPGHSVPSTLQPPLVQRQLVTLTALDTNASPNGWINDGVNETLGNNAEVATDRDGDDHPDLPRPQGSPFRVFDFPLNLGQHPTNYSRAAVVQLFYWCNWIHDKLYDLGFTEAAGNFQRDNFGRGGASNDPVNVLAQDTSNYNNATFGTPPDGSPGTMRTFIWTEPFPDRDCALDAEVIIHEYTHGLSNRRVGGGLGITTLQSRGMGEGWSDFMAGALLSEPGDDVDGVYAMGGYVTYLLGNTDNYYYGVRRYPYCTDTNKSPLTFKDIDPTQIDPHLGVPMNPRFVFSTNTASQVHRVGEVWCNMLWEARANLIKKHGFATGNRLMLQLVMDGMSLSPQNPTFVEARDAIILADRVNNGGANINELWRGFAKRGLGFSAVCPPSTTTTGVYEAYDLPDDLWVTPVGGWLAKGRAGGPFAPAVRLFTLENLGAGPIQWSAAPTAGWLSLSNGSGSLATGAVPASVTVFLNETTRLMPAGRHAGSVVFINQTSGREQTNTLTLLVDVQDFLTENFNDTRDNDLAFSNLTFMPDDSPSGYSVCRAPASTLPTDPAGGTPFAVTSGERYRQVTLSAGRTVALFELRTNTLFLNDDGSISFGEPSTWAQELTDHFAVPRISGLRLTWNLFTPGRTWRELGDRVAVTYSDVGNLFESARATFQMEIFYNGVIRFTYLQLNQSQGIVGLSRGGGLPPDFVESSFSSFPQCEAHLVVIATNNAVESAGTLAGQVNRSESLPFSLTIALSSSAPAKLQVPPTITIQAGQTTAVFTATLVNDAMADGPHPVVITASASGYASGEKMVIVADDDPGALVLTLPASIVEGASAPGVVSLGAPALRNLFVSLASLNTNELESSLFVIIPAGQTSATFSVRAADDRRIDGRQTVSVVAHVSNWPDAVASIAIEDNESLQLFVGLPNQTSEAAGTLTNAGIIRIAGTLTTNLVVSLTSGNVAKLGVPASVSIPAGQTSAVFNLTLNDDSLASTPQPVSVTAGAPGWVAGSAIITIHDDETPSEPSQPRPAHLASDQTTNLVLSWRAAVGELFANGGFETGDFSGWRKESGPRDGDASVYTWYVIDDGTYDPRTSHFSIKYGLLQPFAGAFHAVSVPDWGGGSGFTTLAQDVTIPPNVSTAMLRWTDRILNAATSWSTSRYFRVEIRATNDRLHEVVFATQPGFPNTNGWVTRSLSLARYMGDTVRVVWRQEHAGEPPLHTYIDEASLFVGGPLATTFEVYAGTNASLSGADFRGNTPTQSWTLNGLLPATTYYWTIVVRRGAASVEGPVWQFRTQEAAPLRHFAWSAIATQQVVGQSFATTLTARDDAGGRFTNFNGSVALRATTLSGSRSIFADNFEDGDTAGWSNDVPTTHHYTAPRTNYVVQVSNDNPGAGLRSLALIGGSLVHRDGLVRAFPLFSLRPDRINFRVRASTTNAAGGYFAVGGGIGRPSNPGVLFYMNPAGKMGLYQYDVGLIGTNYIANQWYRISIIFDWVRRRLSCEADGQTIATNVPFGVDWMNIPAGSTLHLYNFHHTQAWWDEIEIIDGQRVTPVVFTPTATANFVNGVWIGQLIPREPADNVSLNADDGATHVGVSGLFSVLSDADGDVDGLPDAWQAIYFGAANAPQAVPSADADGDGATNLQEFQAGTRPNDASSTLRVTSVRLGGNNVEIDFASIAGKMYRLERSEAVQGGLWNGVSGAVLGTGEIVRITDYAGGNFAGRFYRVRLSP